MGKKFSEEEIALIAKGLEMGKTIKRIAEELDRDYGSVNQKIVQMRKQWLHPNGAKVEAKAVVADGMSAGDPEKAAVQTRSSGLGAGQGNRVHGVLRVSEGVATFTMSLKVGNSTTASHGNPNEACLHEDCRAELCQ